MAKHDVATLIARYLPDWRAGWSMGAFGALAEFHQDAGEATRHEDDGLVRATARGAIRFDADRVEQLMPVAYETPSPKPHRWSHAVAFCLPADAAVGHGRAVLTDLGRDDKAILSADRGGRLYDMGLALSNCDFCIRTDNADLCAVLDAQIGRSLFDPANPAMAAILSAHPHRVAITKAGRCEVYQKIGGPETGGKSPPGPHTHVLPKLIASGRTHNANTPIPPGLVPVASLHPGHPVIGSMGEDKPFDSALHDDFQGLFSAHGLTALVAVKDWIRSALAAGARPDGIAMPSGRHERAALKVALRQQAWLAKEAQDATALEMIHVWRHRFDISRDDSDDLGISEHD